MICKHCGKLIRETSSAATPYIHTNGFHECWVGCGETAEPEEE